MAPTDKVFVYHYRHGGNPAVKGGLAVITEQDLTIILDTDTSLQATRKSIPRGAMFVEVYQHDLKTPEQAAEQGKHFNDDADLAGIRIPLKVTIESALAGHFTELVILSEKF